MIQNLAFVNGAASAITYTILSGTSSNTTSIDLRGLGARSTLTLIDGKRVANQNVNALLPTIAIQRLDIVADGTAALYGSEAVAGVVNFVPYTSYDGLKVETFAEQDGRGDYDEHSVQMLWGDTFGNIDVVLAGQFKSNSRLGWAERPLMAQSGLMASPQGPGNYVVPRRNAAGQYTGAAAPVADPACAPASERQYTKAGTLNNPFGMRLGRRCFQDFSDARSLRDPMDISSLFANAMWEVSDELTLSVQGFDARQYIQRYTQLSFPGTTRIAELPTFRGELPGNPFWARNAARQQLYGVDLNGDGVPDRGTADVNRDGLNDYIVSGTADNGVPLHEDVRAAPGFAGRNKTMLPHDGVTPYMVALPNRTNTNSRYSLQADFQVPVLEGWEGFAAYTQSKSEVSQLIDSENDFTAIIQGLNCDVVNDRDACLNPFLVTDQSTQTSKNVAEAIGGLGRNATGTDLDTFDLVLNGELGIELPSGAIGAAVGYQWREEFYRDTPTPLSQAGNTWSRSPFPLSVTTGKREVDAFFAELSVPLLPSLVLEAAVRREDFSTGQQSTDPKFGLTWQATDWLTLRATTGDAFIAPTLVDTLSQPVCSLNSFTDLFTRATGFLTGCRNG